MVHRLRELGIAGPFLRVIHNLLSDRRITIKINGYTSETRQCRIGLPQGSVLSPLLFALYIRDMTDATPGFSLQYADDCSVICWGDSDDELQHMCEEAAAKVDRWLNKWRMQANYSKTDLLCFKGVLSPTCGGSGY